MFSMPPTARAARTIGARRTTRNIPETASRVRRSVVGPGNGTRQATTVASSVSASATTAMKGRVGGMSSSPPSAGPTTQAATSMVTSHLGGTALCRSRQSGHRCREGRIGGSPAGDGKRGRDDCQQQCLVGQGHRKKAQKHQAKHQGRRQQSVPTDPVPQRADHPREQDIGQHPGRGGEPDHQRTVWAVAVPVPCQHEQQRPRKGESQRRGGKRCEVPTDRDPGAHGTTCVGSGGNPLNPTVE